MAPNGGPKAGTRTNGTKNSTHQRGVARTSSGVAVHFTVIAISAVGAALLLTAGGKTANFNSAWAFHTLVHIPLWLRWLLAGLLLAGAVPWVQRMLWRGVERMPNLPAWPLIPLSGLLFWLVREKTLWGDGLLKSALLNFGVGQLSLAERLQRDMYVWKEPLDALLAHATTGLMAPLGWDAGQSVALLSVLAGMVYTWAVIRLARSLAQDRAESVILGAGLLFLGASQLWAGHVENYSLVTAAAYLSVALAVDHLRGRVGLFWVGLTGGLAVSFHPQAAFVLPGLLLLLERERWPRQIFTLGVSGLIVPLITVAALVSMAVPLPFGHNGYAGDDQLFWTVSQALHPRQLWDDLMNLWLLVPGLPILGTWGLIAALGHLRKGPGGQERRTLAYLLAVSGGLLFFHIAFQNDLPRWLDWDLYAIVGPGVALVGWYGLLLARRCEQVNPARPGLVSRLIWPTLIFSLCFSSGWIGVNHTLRLIQPDPEWRELYRVFLRQDLTQSLEQARLEVPAHPLCVDVPEDPTGCQWVARGGFTMPHNGDQRDVIFAHAPARVIFPLALPRERTLLWLSPALDPLAWGWGGDGVLFRVWLRAGPDGAERLLAERFLSPANPEDLTWHELFVDLGPFRGQAVELILETDPGAQGNSDGDRAGWGIGWLIEGTIKYE